MSLSPKMHTEHRAQGYGLMGSNPTVGQETAEIRVNIFF